MSDLDLAQERRSERGAALALAQIDQMLDMIGLSEAEIAERILLGTADVSPHARKKLRPIIDALRKDPHPFTRCMNNLREEQPGWSEDRRKKTCNVLKALAGRSGNSVKASRGSGDACLLVDDDVGALLEMVDLDVLDEIDYARSHEDFAVLSAKKRAKLPPQAFVFVGKRRYPIHDLTHARNALARSSGTPEEAAVKAAVYKKFPQLKPQAGS